VPTSSIDEILCAGVNQWFRISRRSGAWRMGDPMSHYDANSQIDLLTFDISNGKVLANHGADGTLRTLTAYRDTYRACCHPKGWQGVWLGKDASSHGPYAYSLTIAGERTNLARCEWDLETGLIDNIIPVTRLSHPDRIVEATLLSFAPISRDGVERPRGAIYALRLENRSGERLDGEVGLPAPFPEKPGMPELDRMNWVTFDPYGFEFAHADGEPLAWSVPFSLGSGETLWIPTLLYESFAGDGEQSADVPAAILRFGSAGWLEETLAYHRRFLGRLSIDRDQRLAAFFERQVLQAFHSISLSPRGEMSGSNWGTYPPTRQIWIKDTYYTCLPLASFDPALARKAILWFHRYGVRQEGTVVEGGLFHSVSVAVASIILGGIYYAATGDGTFFREHAPMIESWRELLLRLVEGRESDEVWMVPTRFISDGKVECDRHTGSNVCLVRALGDFARIIREAFDDPEAAAVFDGYAKRVTRSIDEHTIVDGERGRYYVEGTNRDGSVPHRESDGEESETTLMPWYGYLAWDDPRYLATMRFAHSPENELYDPELYSIGWKGVPSTAPGYLKALVTGDDAGQFDEHGGLAEIRKVTEADGSLWWWSYGGPGSGREYGKVIRGIPGKSGWFSGIYSVLFLTRFLGITWDAPKKVFGFRPSAALGPFSWRAFAIGSRRFSVVYAPDDEGVTVEIDNPADNHMAVEIEIELDPDDGTTDAAMSVTATPGSAYTTHRPARRTGHPTVMIEGVLDRGAARWRIAWSARR
jgi:hypothetical protein